MNDKRQWRPSLPFLALCILLLGALVFLVGMGVTSGFAPSRLVVAGGGDQNGGPARMETPIAGEAGPLGSSFAGGDHPAPFGKRHLEDFHGRRAYPGAPPFIPHEVPENAEAWGPHCLGCHESGGYAPSLKAFVPLTPHPNFQSCRQCHVPQPGKRLFKANQWVRIPAPRLGQAALGGSPPAIPHAIQLRENCVACHAGEGAIAEIATDHPQRGNCRQCHVPLTTPAVWSRP